MRVLFVLALSRGSRMRSVRTTSSCRSRAARSRSTATSTIRPGRRRASSSDFAQQSPHVRREAGAPGEGRGRDRRRPRSTSARACGRPARRGRRRAHPARRHPAGRAVHRVDRSVAHAAPRVLRSRSPRAACAPTGSTPTTTSATATRRGIRCGSRKAQILADGWSAEMAIPLSQLRLPRAPLASWGIDFNWYVPHRNEDVFWRRRCRSIARRGRATSAS